jgi:hypothetical protein
MAPSRKPSTPYQRRNELARQAGFRNYYEQRLSRAGGERSRARGHRGTADMLRAIRPGVTISMTQPLSQTLAPEPRRRRAKTKTGKFQVKAGKPVWLTVDVYPEINKLLIGVDGMGREFTIRNITRPELVTLIAEEIRRGASFVKAPSFDQRRLVTDDESEGGY